MSEEYTVVGWRWQYWKDTGAGRKYYWSYTENEPSPHLNPQPLYVKNDVQSSEPDVKP